MSHFTPSFISSSLCSVNFNFHQEHSLALTIRQLQSVAAGNSQKFSLLVLGVFSAVVCGLLGWDSFA